MKINLLEKKLSGEFTFGFELEGIFDSLEYESDLENYFDRFFENGTIQTDGSVSDDSCWNFDFSDRSLTSEYEGETYYESSDDRFDEIVSSENVVTPFEWASPVLQFNPKTIQQVLKLLSNPGRKWYTNDSCGLHHHISYKGITIDDVVWIMSHLSQDFRMLDKLTMFKDYSFNSTWSKIGYITETWRKAVEELDYKTISSLINTDKYSLLNVHSHKTIEWRGPRDFLHSEHYSPEVLKEFYKVLWDFVQWISNTLQKKEINGISKENFLKQVNVKLKQNSTLIPSNWEVTHTPNELSIKSITQLFRKMWSDDSYKTSQMFLKNKKLRNKINEFLKSIGTLSNGDTNDLGFLYRTITAQNQFDWSEVADEFFWLFPTNLIAYTSDTFLQNNVTPEIFTKIMDNFSSLSSDNLDAVVPYLKFKTFKEEDIKSFIACTRGAYLHTIADQIESDNLVEQLMDEYLRHIDSENITKDNIQSIELIAHLTKVKPVWRANKRTFNFYISKLLLTQPNLLKYIDSFDETMLSLILIKLWNTDATKYKEFQQALEDSKFYSREEIEQQHTSNIRNYKNMFDE